MHDVNIFYKISVEGIHKIIIKKKQPSVTAVPATEGYLCSLLISNIVFSPHFRVVPSRVHQSHSNSTQRECAFCLARYGRFLGDFLIVSRRGRREWLLCPVRESFVTTHAFLHGIMRTDICPTKTSFC